ncbi:hypothetical protein JTB14_011685 [Gonioctena quinquepunctata]|nr:hypothetical protein JTB14_011685 [Gonioctena quinquepunctata]
MTLLEYSFTIKYRSGRDNSNSDALTRLRVSEDESVIPKTEKTAEEGQNDDETSELAYVLTPEEFEKQSKFYKAEAQGNIKEKIIHYSVEENTSELQVELPHVEGLENNTEVQKTNGTENGREIITKDELKNKIDIESSDSEEDEVKPFVTHRYPTRSRGPIEYFSLEM